MLGMADQRYYWCSLWRSCLLWETFRKKGAIHVAPPPTWRLFDDKNTSESMDSYLMMAQMQFKPGLYLSFELWFEEGQEDTNKFLAKRNFGLLYELTELVALFARIAVDFVHSLFCIFTVTGGLLIRIGSLLSVDETGTGFNSLISSLSVSLVSSCRASFLLGIEGGNEISGSLSTVRNRWQGLFDSLSMKTCLLPQPVNTTLRKLAMQDMYFSFCSLMAFPLPKK